MSETDLYELQPLMPDRVAFYRSPGGMLQGKINGILHSELLLYRAFPLQYPDRYISVRDAEGKELGIIENLQHLDEASRQELETELQRRYFLPKVLGIQDVRQKNDLWEWELETDAGAVILRMHNLHDHVQLHNHHRIMLTDINGRRCEISDLTKLDIQSRKRLNDVI